MLTQYNSRGLLHSKRSVRPDVDFHLYLTRLFLVHVSLCKTKRIVFEIIPKTVKFLFYPLAGGIFLLPKR